MIKYCELKKKLMKTEKYYNSNHNEKKENKNAKEMCKKQN